MRRGNLTGYLVVLLSSVLLAACGGNSNSKPDAGVDASLEGFDEPDIYCPGSPGCMSAGVARPRDEVVAMVTCASASA